MSQPTPGQVATDCACSTHYFPESRKWAIYYCLLHAHAEALRGLLARLITHQDEAESSIQAATSLDMLAYEARALLATIQKGGSQ